MGTLSRTDARVFPPNQEVSFKPPDQGTICSVLFRAVPCVWCVEVCFVVCFSVCLSSHPIVALDASPHNVSGTLSRTHWPAGVRSHTMDRRQGGRCTRIFLFSVYDTAIDSWGSRGFDLWRSHEDTFHSFQDFIQAANCDTCGRVYTILPTSSGIYLWYYPFSTRKVYSTASSGISLMYFSRFRLFVNNNVRRVRNPPVQVFTWVSPIPDPSVTCAVLASWGISLG